jgi:hypothetical protein
MQMDLSFMHKNLGTLHREKIILNLHQCEMHSSSFEILCGGEKIFAEKVVFHFGKENPSFVMVSILQVLP